MKKWFMLLPMVAVLTLTSCATAPNSNVDEYFSFTSVDAAVKYAEAHDYAEQASLLSDGEVTEEDYRTANGLFRACLEEVGYRFGEEITIDPINGLQLQNEWNVTPGESGQLADKKLADQADSCQDAFDTVEMAYIGTHEKRMDPTLRAAIEQCALSQDIEVSEQNLTIDSMLEGSNDARRDIIQSCLFTSMGSLFPGLEFVGY